MKTYLKFIKTLNEIKKSFSIVIVNFFFNFKQIEIDENNNAKKIVKNNKHIVVRFNIFNFNFDAKRCEFVYIRQRTMLSQLSQNHFFLKTFENALNINYNIKRMMN